MPGEELDKLLDDLIKQAMAFEITIDKLILDYRLRRKLLLLDLTAIQLN